MSLSPETQQAVAAIDKAIASGNLRVRFGDRDITARSYAELRQIRADLIARDQAGSGFRVSYPKMTKGIL